MTQISCGQDHTCALRTDGSVACWGANEYGQLGDGKINDPQSAPQTVPGLSNVVEIATNNFNSCARLNDGSIECWGNNGWGQIGDGTNTNRLVPTKVQF